MRLTDLLNLSNVPRWGIVPRFREQSVADHTFRVMVIAWELADRMGIPLTATDFRYILCHDADETWTGDISGLSKHAIPDLELGTEKVKAKMDLKDSISPSSESYALIKAADIIDCLAFADAWIHSPRREWVWDRNLVVLADHCKKYASEFPGDFYPVARKVLQDITEDTGRCSTPDWLKDRREEK